MLKVTCRITGLTPLCFGAALQSPKNTGESFDAYEERCWMERLHKDSKGQIFIPANALKNTLTEVAKFLSESVPGNGKAKFTKHFEAGILITEPIYVGCTEKEVKKIRLYVPADGRKGGSTRVWRNFPVIEQWSGMAELLVVDPLLESKAEKIEEYLKHAGRMIGLLTFRPRKGGQYGRFEISEFKSE